MIDYFIIGHNTNILDNCTPPLPNLQRVLVGINHRNTKDYIHCAALPDNIEHLPKLCSFTGWYAISKNKLYTNKIIGLLEYDIVLSSMFHNTNTNLIKLQQENNNTNYIIAYHRTLTNHYVFYKSTPWLEISLKYAYNINLIDLVNHIKHSHPFWPTTTNITLPTHICNGFVDWFDPMTKYFDNHALGAYVQERAFFIYCVLNNIKITYADNVLYHKQLCSHQHQDLYGQFLATKNTTVFSPSHIPEYDTIYNRCISQCMPQDL